MGIYLDHVNTVLGKLRETEVSDLSSDPSTEAYRAQTAVQRAVQRIWNAKHWSFRKRTTPWERDSDIDGVINPFGFYRNLVLPKEVGEIFAIQVPTSPYILTPMEEKDYARISQLSPQTGDPIYYVLGKTAGLSHYKTSATNPGYAKVYAASTSASDNTQKVTIRGVHSKDFGLTAETVETISLNGTNPVLSTNEYYWVISVGKSGDTSGSVVVGFSGDPITDLIMGPKDRSASSTLIKFYPTPPSGDLFYTIHHFALPPVLSGSAQATEIPERWDYVVDQFAFALALQSKGIEKEAEFKTQFELASKFLEQDMMAEEAQSSERIITPGKVGMGAYDPWNQPPAGYGTLSY